jgi:hypothetical protein
MKLGDQPLTPTLSPQAGRGSSGAPSIPRPVYGEREGPAPQAWEGEGLGVVRFTGGCFY